jgi:lysozyme
MINNKIDYQVALEVASHEAIVRQAYKDTKGIWTWSIGLTNASGHTVERYIGKPQTLQHCLAVYVWALEKYATDVRKAFTRPLTQAQFAAALSFHYNTGAIGRATWVKSFNSGNSAAAKNEIMNYKSPKEIIPRRQKEQALFFEGKWSNKGTILEYQNVSKNYQPINPKSINIEKELKAAFGFSDEKTQTKPIEKIKPVEPIKQGGGGIAQLIINLIKVLLGRK